MGDERVKPTINTRFTVGGEPWALSRVTLLISPFLIFRDVRNINMRECQECEKPLNTPILQVVDLPLSTLRITVTLGETYPKRQRNPVQKAVLHKEPRIVRALFS